MPSADVGVTLSPKLTIVSAAAGRMRVQANGFRFDAARTLAIEETVANLTGVRAVRAYPRTGSVVIWYSPEHCDIAAVLTAIADGEHIPAASVPARVRHSTAVGNGGVVEKVIGGMARTLLRSRGDGLDVPRRSRGCARRWIVSAITSSRRRRPSRRRTGYGVRGRGRAWLGRWVFS